MNIANSLLLIIFTILNTCDALQRLSWKDPSTWVINQNISGKSRTPQKGSIQFQPGWTSNVGSWWWEKNALEQFTYIGDKELRKEYEATVTTHGPDEYDTYSNKENWSGSLKRGYCDSCTSKRPKADVTVKRKWRWFKRNFVKASYEGNELIRCVIVENNWKDGTGGYVNVVTGGPRMHHFYIELKSQYSRGFSFTISIYTHCPDFHHFDQHLRHHHHDKDIDKVDNQDDIKPTTVVPPQEID